MSAVDKRRITGRKKGDNVCEGQRVGIQSYARLEYLHHQDAAFDCAARVSELAFKCRVFLRRNPTECGVN